MSVLCRAWQVHWSTWKACVSRPSLLPGHVTTDTVQSRVVSEPLATPIRLSNVKHVPKRGPSLRLIDEPNTPRCECSNFSLSPAQHVHACVEVRPAASAGPSLSRARKKPGDVPCRSANGDRLALFPVLWHWSYSMVPAQAGRHVMSYVTAERKGQIPRHVWDVAVVLILIIFLKL